MRSCKRLNQDEWPNLSEIDGFAGKLAGAAAEIKRDAEGRTCGGCRNLHNTWCTKQQNIDGYNLTVLYPGAVACGHYEGKAS